MDENRAQRFIGLCFHSSAIKDVLALLNEVRLPGAHADAFRRVIERVRNRTRNHFSQISLEIDLCERSEFRLHPRIADPEASVFGRVQDQVRQEIGGCTTIDGGSEFSFSCLS